jgi:hypothetical protein
MATVTVPFAFLARGYRLSGDTRSGLKATVPYLVAWADAFTFVNQVLVSPAAERIGLISWNAPLQFPVAFGGRTPAMYVQGFDVTPVGAGNEPGPTGGLAPGEYYTDAIVTLQFESVTYLNQASDDPYNLNQLDPANPITACEQSVKLRPRMRSTKGRGWKYKGSGKPVPGDMPVPETEAILVLKFPRVPYLPWELVAPFCGKVNQDPLLGCATGALMLEGLDTEIRPQPDGSLGQSAVLEFSVNLPADPNTGGAGAVGTDWNKQPTADGSGAWDYVVDQATGSVSPIGYADFRQIFASLSFSG